MEDGVFGKNYISYEVQAEPLEWIITRRLRDFDTLRILIVKYFNNNIILPLSNKKMRNRIFDSMKIMKFLNLLINNVV